MVEVLVIVYSMICFLVFKVFKVPLNKWTGTTAVLGGIASIGRAASIDVRTGLQEVQGEPRPRAEVDLHPGALRALIIVAIANAICGGPKRLDELSRRVRRQVHPLQRIHKAGQVRHGRDEVEHRQARGQGGEGESLPEERHGGVIQ